MMEGEPRVYATPRKCKGRTTWHLQWTDPDTHKRKSRKVEPGKRIPSGYALHAKREASRLEDKLRKGENTEELKRVSWDEFVTEHVAAIPGNVDRADAERTLRFFGEACSPRGPHTVTYAMVETFVAWLRERGCSTATINKRLRYLRGSMNKAVKRGYITRSPMDDWIWEREEEPIPRALTAGEKVKLLAACPSEQWKAFVTVALHTGCRRGELLGLVWADIDCDNSVMVVRHTKSKRDRVQPLNTVAVEALRGMLCLTLKDAGPFRSMNRNTTCQRFRDIVRAAGIPRCTLHDLRRSFATDLARLGINQLVAQKLCGHASASTTARYYQAIDDGMKMAAVSKLA